MTSTHTQARLSQLTQAVAFFVTAGLGLLMSGGREKGMDGVT